MPNPPIMMTSSNGNIFRVTGHLCWEFTGHRWIPRTKASDAELWRFLLICVWINGWVNNGEAGDLRRHRAIMTSLYCYDQGFFFNGLSYNRQNVVISSRPSAAYIGQWPGSALIQTVLACRRSIIMMTSSNGNIFRVTGHLCGEFTGPRWIPRTKASDAELWCFLWSAFDKRLSKQSRGWWFETPCRSLWRQSNDLNICWLFVNWTLRNKLQWNLNQNTKRFIQEHAFENVVCEMAVILSRERWVNQCTKLCKDSQSTREPETPRQIILCWECLFENDGLSSLASRPVHYELSFTLCSFPGYLLLGRLKLDYVKVRITWWRWVLSK